MQRTESGGHLSHARGCEKRPPQNKSNDNKATINEKCTIPSISFGLPFTNIKKKNK